MDHRKMNTLALVVTVTLFGGQYLIRGVGANAEAVEHGFCLDNCMKGCKGPLKCFKHCRKHCGPPAAAASVQMSHSLHFCKLGCMLDKCSKFSQDEAKQESCVAECELNVCLAG